MVFGMKKKKELCPNPFSSMKLNIMVFVMKKEKELCPNPLSS